MLRLLTDPCRSLCSSARRAPRPRVALLLPFFRFPLSRYLLYLTLIGSPSSRRLRSPGTLRHRPSYSIPYHLPPYVIPKLCRASLLRDTILLPMLNVSVLVRLGPFCGRLTFWFFMHDGSCDPAALWSLCTATSRAASLGFPHVRLRVSHWCCYHTLNVSYRARFCGGPLCQFNSTRSHMIPQTRSVP